MGERLREDRGAHQLVGVGRRAAGDNSLGYEVQPKVTTSPGPTSNSATAEPLRHRQAGRPTQHQDDDGAGEGDGLAISVVV